jgi:hypothetical protein
MGKKLCLILIVLHFYCISNAQNNRFISFGIDANIGTSAQLFSINSLHYSFTAAKEISFYTFVKGTEEHALDFLGKLGFSMNPIKYRIAPGSSFTIEQLNLSLSGFILFPTKYPSFFVLGGISVDYCMEPLLESSTGSTSSSGSSVQTLYMDLDSNWKDIRAYQRRLIPAVNIGFHYFPFSDRSRFSFYAIVKQPLLAMFSDDVVVTYVVNGQAKTATINYYPLQLKLGVMCRL